VRITVAVVADLGSAVLIMEFVLHGIAMLIGMEAAVQPLTDHLGFRPARPFGLAIGAVDLAAAGALVLGFSAPGLSAVAAGYAVAFFGLLMVQRLRRGLGTLVRPPDFPIFFTLAVLLLAIRLGQAAG